MHASIDGGIDCEIEDSALATTQAHVGNATLPALLLSIFGILGALGVRVGGPFNTLDDIRHATATVASENLDGCDIGLLGNTELGAGNGTRAVSSVTVAILISIALRNGLAPFSTTFEIDVLNVGTGIDNVGVDTLTGICGVNVLGDVSVEFHHES